MFADLGVFYFENFAAIATNNMVMLRVGESFFVKGSAFAIGYFLNQVRIEKLLDCAIKCGSRKFDIFVGRIRYDLGDTKNKTINLFLSGDQLLKGAALNAYQILDLCQNININKEKI